MIDRVQKVLKSRFFAVALALALTGLALAVPSTTNACPPHEIETTYYTDASKTVECGWKIITCGCGVYQEGCVTSYYTRFTSAC